MASGPAARGEGETGGGEVGDGEAGEGLSGESARQEKEHFQKVINAFLYYKPYVLRRVDRLRGDYLSLPFSHRKMLPDYTAHLERVVEAVDMNELFVQMIVSCAANMFENSEISRFDPDSVQVTPAPSFDMEKVKTTIKQFFRDWSKEGASERNMCYKPIIDDIIHYFPPDSVPSSEVSVLVPGAGLGRLAYEIASRGYTCQGNEFSMYMLFGSNFILNSVSKPYSFTICPWVSQFSNTMSYDHQTTEVRLPDISPTALPQYGLFSMTAGDFLDVYRTPDSWDCVACSFFIDTAHNIIQYMETIYHILKPGGLWINIGPLLYHYSDIPGELSLELSWEDVCRIARDEIGFQILTEKTDVPSHYIQNPCSMIQMTYKCVYLVARKPEKAPPTSKRSTVTHSVESVTDRRISDTSCTASSEAESPWPL